MNISGVTVDGAGVFAEAGIVYLDAQGTIHRSRVTNVTTSELAADSTTKPGAWRGPQFGYGIAQVTANTSAPAGATTRTLTISQTRVERYNRAGVLIDGATNDLAPYSASGVVNRGVLSNNAIVGKLVCTNFTVNGNCSSSGSPGNNLTTTGPLYGQDGVRVTAGASVALTGNTISQNLVHGAGAPTRGAATNNANLPLGAGVRLVGAAASTAARNNILDNAYGVINVGLDGTTPNTAVPFAAENNWWGLRSTASATERRPGDLADQQPAVPGEPGQRRERRRRRGHELDRGRLLPVPQRLAGRHRVRPVRRLRRAAAGRRRRSDRVAQRRPRPGLPRRDPQPDRQRRRRLRRQARHALLRRRPAGRVHGAAVHARRSRSPRTPPATPPRTFTAIVEDSAGQTAFASTSVIVRCVTAPVGGTVPATLALTLGAPASFGAFTPGVAATYNASTTANVLSTAGDATLTVTDPGAQAPGHLVNGSFSLPQALRARATNAANPNTSFGTVSGSPLTLLTYPGPISNDGVALQFQQQIGSTDALRTGQYSKTLTFTLSTTAP